MSGVSGRFIKRDPKGYKGSPYCLYEAFESHSLQETDPTEMAVVDSICRYAVKSVIEGPSFSCDQMAQIVNEFGGECNRECDIDLRDFMDHYHERGRLYCGCMGVLCPNSSTFMSEYADLCCVLIKVRKAEIRYGKPDSKEFGSSVGNSLR